jgi:hypothetical protein
MKLFETLEHYYLSAQWVWQQYGGTWSLTGADLAAGAGAPVFPLSIMDVLVFLLIVQLAARFNAIVTNIAKDIAGSSINLNMQGGLGDLFNKGQQALSGGKKGEGERGGGGGRGGRGGAGAGGGGFRPNLDAVRNDVAAAIREAQGRRQNPRAPSPPPGGGLNPPPRGS